MRAACTLSIDEASEGQRLDNCLFKHYPSVPKSHLYRLIRSGQLRINKKRSKPTDRLNQGDEVRIPPLFIEDKPNPPTAWIKQPNSPFQALKQAILYEDEACLILNKPSGIPVHGGSGIHAGVIEALRVLYPQYRHLELVHRLDKDTSGCLMIAKKPSALRYLHTLIRDRALDKTYWALLKGNWPYPDDHVVDLPLYKYRLGSGARKVIASPQGKPCVSYFTCKMHLKGASWVVVKLETGRTHQIRVHAAEKGFPVLGDERYDKDFKPLPHSANRLMLHAFSLTLVLPGTHVPVTVQAQPDSIWTAVMDRYKTP